jgi:hypothetical protein
VLLMDVAFLPFAASVLAQAFQQGHGERTAVVFHGLAFELAAILFNLIWWYARRDRRLLAASIDSAGVKAIGRRFLAGAPTFAERLHIGVLVWQFFAGWAEQREAWARFALEWINDWENTRPTPEKLRAARAFFEKTLTV